MNRTPSWVRLGFSQGLSQQSIQALAEADDGAIWVGTQDAVNRFDGFAFKPMRPDLAHGGARIHYSEDILALLNARDRGMFSVSRHGLTHVDASQQVWRRWPFDDPALQISRVEAGVETTDGRVWLATDVGLAEVNTRTGQVALRAPEIEIPSITAMLALDDQRLLLATTRGLWLWLTGSREFKSLAVARYTEFLFQDADGRIWGADAESLFVLDDQLHEAGTWSLAGLGVEPQPLVMARAPNGDLWMGGTQGVYRRRSEALAFEHYAHDAADPESLPPGAITDLLAGRDGVMWVGSGVGGLAKWMPASDGLVYLRPGRAASLAGPVGFLTPAGGGRVLFGNTAGDVGVLDWRTGLYQMLVQPGQLRDTTGRELWLKGALQDRKQRLWLATVEGVFRWQTGRLSYAPFERVDGEPLHMMLAPMAEDATGRIWVGHSRGLQYWSEEQQRFVAWEGPSRKWAFGVLHILSLASDLWIWADDGELKRWTPSTGDWRVYPLTGFREHRLAALHLSAGPNGQLLLSTDQGLYQLNPINGALTRYTTRDGLANGFINAAVATPDGRIWAATNHGLSVLPAGATRFVNLDRDEGVHHGEFFSGTAFVQDGQLLFVGSNGIAVVPAEFAKAGLPTALPQVEEVHIDGRVDAEARALLNRGQALTIGERAELSLKISTASHQVTESVEFAFRESGDWRPLARDSRQWALGQLRVGTHQLEVAVRRIGEQDWRHRQVLTVIVPPPWWRHTLVRIAVVLLGLLLVGGLARWQIGRLQQRNRLLESMVGERTARIQALLNQRERLFASVSHELRTPLMLIDGLVRDWLTDPRLQPVLPELNVAQRNVTAVTRLIDNLLTLLRNRATAREAEMTAVPLLPLVSSYVEAFARLADDAELQLRAGQIDDVTVWAAPGHLDVVLSNLLLNAIKYTPAGGKVDIRVLREGGQAVIHVQDTGIGIAEAVRERIFEPFARGGLDSDDALLRRPGVGLGLANVRESVTAMGGDIEVDSTPGGGSWFRILLPLHEDVSMELLDTVAVPADVGRELPVVVLIEDNPDLLEYLCERLAPDFCCLGFASGTRALKAIYENVPDAVVSDCQLADMAGMEICRVIRDDWRTCHIPFVLITGDHAPEVYAQGMASRADDVLRKPFQVEDLTARLRNLLQRVAQLRKDIPATLPVDEPGVSPASANGDGPVCNEQRPADVAFLERFRVAVSADMANPALSVPALAQGLYLSQKQLERKLRALTGCTPMEVVRRMRMEAAAALLQQGRSIIDVTFSVGYSSQSHFTVSFKQHHGMTPKQWQQRARS